jgi:hypothetical protein
MYSVSSNNIKKVDNDYFNVKLCTTLKTGDYDLVHFCATNQLYNIIKNCNDMFTIELTEYEDDYKQISIIIPEGNYSIYDFINSVNKLIHYELTMIYKNHLKIILSYNNINGKLTFTPTKCKIKLIFSENNICNILLGFRHSVKDFSDIITSDNVIDLYHLNSFVGINIKESLIKPIRLSDSTECNWIFPMDNAFQSKKVFMVTKQYLLKLRNATDELNIKFYNQDGILLKEMDQWTFLLKKI